MHVLEPFLPDVFQTPDHTASDLEVEIAIHYTIQRQLEAFLKGGNGGTLLAFNDCLAQYGIDPIEYWDIVSENIDTLIEKGTALEQTKLILPEYHGSPIRPIY